MQFRVQFFSFFVIFCLTLLTPHTRSNIFMQRKQHQCSSCNRTIKGHRYPWGKNCSTHTMAESGPSITLPVCTSMAACRTTSTVSTCNIIYIRRPRGDMGRKKNNGNIPYVRDNDHVRTQSLSRTYAIMIPYVRNHYLVRTQCIPYVRNHYPVRTQS